REGAREIVARNARPRRGGRGGKRGHRTQDRRYDRRQCAAANPGLAPSAVAKRNSGRRGRSRKRRAAPERATGAETRVVSGGGESVLEGESSPARNRPARSRTRGPDAEPRRRGAPSDTTAMGERPQAPWHPLPLSELLILVGVIGAVVAWSRGIASNGSLLAVGIAAVLIGTVEFTLREHLSGYRSHTIMLALLPAVVFHSVVVLLVSALGSVPRWLNVVLLPLDGALFAVLFKLLRARFLDARRERIFTGG